MDAGQEQRTRRRLREWPIVVVLAAVAISLFIVANGHFRRGCILLAGAVMLAFFLRALLPSTDAGMLAVRSRRVDVAVLGVLGIAVSVLSFWVPPPS
jgi:cation transport ATPase